MIAGHTQQDGGRGVRVRDVRHGEKDAQQGPRQTTPTCPGPGPGPAPSRSPSTVCPCPCPCWCGYTRVPTKKAAASTAPRRLISPSVDGEGSARANRCAGV